MKVQMVDKVQSCCFRMVVKVQMVDMGSFMDKVQNYQNCQGKLVSHMDHKFMGIIMDKVHYCQNCQGKLVSHMDQIFESNYLVRKSLINSNCSVENW